MALTSIFPGIPHIESPLFHEIVETLGLAEDERRVAIELHERGYAVFDFPDPEFCARVERLKASLSPVLTLAEGEFNPAEEAPLGGRVQDAWRFNADVQAIAANDRVLQLLGKLYGRAAFPFQTLNFPVGTEQRLHSDSIHFSSIPERFMCGVWVAMEDVSPDSGPLTYMPGTHKWPVIKNIDIGRKGTGTQQEHAQLPFQTAWDALVENSTLEEESFLPRKGQALIWAANLLHGGSARRNRMLTRWSQVTHYYFDGCIYYTPAFSDEGIGSLDVREVVDVSTGKRREHRYLGQPWAPPAPPPLPVHQRLRRRMASYFRSGSRMEGRARPDGRLP